MWSTQQVSSIRAGCSFAWGSQVWVSVQARWYQTWQPHCDAIGTLSTLTASGRRSPTEIHKLSSLCKTSNKQDTYWWGSFRGIKRSMSIGRSVGPPLWFWLSQQWMDGSALTFCTRGYGPQRMNHLDSGDPPDLFSNQVNLWFGHHSC